MDSNAISRRSLDSAIRSLLLQLAYYHDSALQLLQDYYKSKIKEGYVSVLGSSKRITKEMLSILHNMLDLHNSEPVYLLIDAVDEAEAIGDFLDGVAEISQWNLECLHFLLLSRPTSVIQMRMSQLSATEINLEPAVVNSDIEIFVDEAMLRVGGKWPNKLQNEVREYLKEQSDGV